MILLRNIFKCNSCGDVVESTHRNELVSCTCQSLSVDGGREYVRVLGDPDKYTDLTLWLSSKPITRPKLKLHDGDIFLSLVKDP